LEQHKPWFDEGCSELLHRRKQSKLQWLQDPSQINGDNLNNVRLEASRHCRNERGGYPKDIINELESYSKKKNIRELYKGYVLMKLTVNICLIRFQFKLAWETVVYYPRCFSALL
jgi:hypothetical protein